MRVISFSNGSEYNPARLTVMRDWLESNGKWRLYWDAGPDSPTRVCDESTVCGAHVHFRTMRDAIAYGSRKHGETAVKVAQ
jgi:hypothetical protein